MLLVLLQNAWSTWYTRIGKPGEDYHRLKDRVWHRDDWIAATWGCRSGAKLAKILADIPDEQIWLDDTTLEIADKASGSGSVRPPDLDHVRGVLRDQKITAVLACGKQAGKAIDQAWAGPLVKIPHPACRVIGNSVCREYNGHVLTMMEGARQGGIYSVYRAQVDSRGTSTFTLMHGENNGSSWILEGIDQQAAGVAGGSEGDDPGVLSAEQPA